MESLSPNTKDGGRHDAILEREAQIIRLHKASTAIMEAELARLKGQSKEQRTLIKLQMDKLKKEAYDVQVAHQKGLYEDFLGINSMLNPLHQEARALTNYELGLSTWNDTPLMGAAINLDLSSRPLVSESLSVPPHYTESYLER